MKILLLPISLLLSAALVVGLVDGCTTNQQRAAANTLSATHDVVQTGVVSYYDAALKGLASTRGISPVGIAYDRFQEVYGAAVDLARNNTNAVAPEKVLQEAGSVAAVVDQFYHPAAANIKTKLKLP